MTSADIKTNVKKKTNQRTGSCVYLYNFYKMHLETWNGMWKGCLFFI